MRAGLSAITACSLARRTRLTRPLQRLSIIGRDYMQKREFVNEIMMSFPFEVDILAFTIYLKPQPFSEDRVKFRTNIPLNRAIRYREVHGFS